jgi:cellulose synthase/poly-beta-1,6-N-acetylglucosamine synthase-like glycosyltransferase
MAMYGLLAFMISTTLTVGMVFHLADRFSPNPFYVVTTMALLIFLGFWVVRTASLLAIAAFYQPYVVRMKTQARAQRSGHPYHPFVSVVIPAYNEQVGLVNTVKTLLASTYRNMEIIVVNDGSTDHTATSMHRFLTTYAQSMQGALTLIPVYCLTKPRGGKGSALNSGIAQARGEIVCTFDADTVVAQQCIERLVSYFVEPSIMAVAGNIKIGNRKQLIGMVQHLEYFLDFQMKQAEAMLGTIFVIGGANAALRKSVFEQIGGYDPGMLTEDMELSFRLQRAGLRIFYAHDACVYTEGPSTWSALFRQRLRWKRGRVEVMHAYRACIWSQQMKNKLFFWGSLPLVFVQDVQMVICNILLLLVYLFCFQTWDFTPILATIVLAGTLYGLHLLQDPHERKWSSLLVAPLVWFLLQIAVLVSTRALIMAYLTFWTKQKVTWQKHRRRGALEAKRL